MAFTFKTGTWFLLLAALATATARAEFKFDANGLSNAGKNWSGKTLSSRTIYTVNDTDTTLDASGTSSPALTADGDTCIYIPAGRTLTVKGGNGSGDKPGQPGISLPEGKTLIIVGEGKLIAQGGKAGNGGDAKTGGNAWMSGSHFSAGTGGKGGSGGGSSGAGIGGAGGGGGPGGTGGDIDEKRLKDVDAKAKDQRRALWGRNGNSGATGSQGFEGGSYGQLVVLGTVTVQATGGAAGDKAGSGKGWGSKEYDWFTAGGTQWHNAGGGGGGGGGGSGYQSTGIGAGRGGAGGGGGGGTGGFLWRYVTAGYEKRRFNLHGYAGLGGKGNANGGDGQNDTGWSEGGGPKAWCSCDNSPHYGGGVDNPSGGKKGADGGPAGSTGASSQQSAGNQTNPAAYRWNVYKATGASVSASPSQITVKEQNTFDGLDFKIMYKDGDLRDSRCTYGDKMVSVGRPVRDGWQFFGFYTEPKGKGEMYYDAMASTEKTYTKVGDLQLYAYWKRNEDVDWTGITVNGYDLALESGNGWRYKDGKAELYLGRSYIIAGTNTNKNISFKITDSAELVFSSLCLASAPSEGSLFSFASARNSTVKLIGDNLVAGTNVNEGVALPFDVQGTLVVTNNDSEAGQALTLVGGGSNPAIRTRGTVTIGGGRIDAVSISGSAVTATLGGTTASGSFKVNGGTVRLKSGGTAASTRDVDASVATTITGGSVYCAGGSSRDFGTRPKNATGKSLRCMVTAVPDSPSDRIAPYVYGLIDYNFNYVYPIEDRLYLWVPENSNPRFYVNGLPAWATVKSADTRAYFAETGLFVDGCDVGTARGTGWKWSPVSSNLVFSVSDALGSYALTGANTDGMVHPLVDRDVTLTLTDVTLTGYGAKTGIVDIVKGTTTLKVPSGTSTIRGSNDHYRGAGIYVGPNAVLDIPDGSGTLNVKGGMWGCGIGGMFGSGGKVSVSGANIHINVSGGFEGAAIGGGVGTPGIVYGTASSYVSTTAGFNAEGIGAGAWADIDGPTDMPISRSDVKTYASGSLVVSTLTDDAFRKALSYAATVGGTVTFAENLSGVIRLNARVAVTGNAAFGVDGGGRMSIEPATPGKKHGEGGGAIFNSGTGAMTLENLSFRNFKSGSGGAVRSCGSLTLRNCTFEYNEAVDYGGAVYMGPPSSADAPASSATTAALICENCRFAKNTAGASGGAVFHRGPASFDRCCFLLNTATYGGAAVGGYAPTRTTCVRNSSFFENTAGERGGGMDEGAGIVFCLASTFDTNAGGSIWSTEVLEVLSCVAVGATSPFPERGADFDGFGIIGASYSTFGSMNQCGTFTQCFKGAEPSDMFMHPRTEKTVDGVVQTYRALVNRNKSYVQGCAAWYTVDGGSVGWSKSIKYKPTSPFYGMGGAWTLTDPDQLGRARTDLTLFAGAVVDAAETESLVVTTTADVVDPDDGFVSLREAISYSSSSDMPRRSSDGFREVTFDASFFANASRSAVFTVSGDSSGDGIVISGGRFVAVKGPEDGSKLTIEGASGVKRLFVVNDDSSLETENVTFGPLDQGDTCIVHSAGDYRSVNCLFDGRGTGSTQIHSVSNTLWIEESTFRGSRISSGALVSAGGLSGHLLNCTITDNQTSSKNGKIINVVRAPFDVLSCTIAENKAAAGSAVLTATGNVAIANSVIVGNRVGTTACDLQSPNAGAYKLVRSVYGTPSSDEIILSENASYGGEQLANTLDGAARTLTYRGVKHSYYRQNLDGSAYRTGGFICHSDIWADIGCSTDAKRSQVTGVRGSESSSVNILQSTDIVGRPVQEGYISMGSYATCCDEEFFTEGSIVVNSDLDHGKRTDIASSYDGIISLRDAVTFAQEHTEFRDANGNCTITFGDEFAGGGCIISKMHQLEVMSGFESGALIIAPTKTDPITFDGDNQFRPLAVGAGNRVILQNAIIQNTYSGLHGTEISTTHGAGVYNAGVFVASNVVFKNCWATQGKKTDATLSGGGRGGAVYTENGGLTLLYGCTFTENVAAYGGAVAVAKKGILTCVNSTITGNETRKSASITAEVGGAVWAEGTPGSALFVNCTVTGNKSVKYAGGLYAGGNSTTTPTLRLVNCIVVGNTAGSGYGAGDLRSDGLTALFRTAWGERENYKTQDTKHWRDTFPCEALSGGCACSNVFSSVYDVTVNQAEPVPVDVGGVEHTVYTLRSGIEYGVVVRADAYWTNVTCGTSSDATDTPVIGYERLAASGTVLRRDIRGTPLYTDAKTPLGPYAKYEASFLSSVPPPMMLSAALPAASDPEILFEAVPGAQVIVTNAAALPTLVATARRKAATVGGLDVTCVETDDGWTLYFDRTISSAVPVSVADIDISDENFVSVMLEGTLPNRLYGLGWSVMLEGNYSVEDWVRADAEGNLPGPLVAPKPSGCGFYRVFER